MTAKDKTDLGQINVSSLAIATVASQAAVQSYGVVGMAAKNVVDGLTHLILQDPRHGVEVLTRDTAIIINLYVVVEYGTRLTAVAASLANNVRFSVEQVIGLPVAEVNVFIQGLRVTHPDA